MSAHARNRISAERTNVRPMAMTETLEVDTAPVVAQPKKVSQKYRARRRRRLGAGIDRRSPQLQELLESVPSLAWLAIRIGVCRQAISRWNKIPLSRVTAISHATGIPPENLRPDAFDIFEMHRPQR